MASVLIIDDNRSKSAFLKISLMRRRHQVRRTPDIGEAVNPKNGGIPDVILINQATNNSAGWEIFNHLKQLAPDISTMVYALENNCFDSADWICKAVDAVCQETSASLLSPVASVPRVSSSTMNSVAK